MVAGFPVALLELVRCTDDGGALAAPPGAPAAGVVVDGVVRCARCRREYPVRAGILRLLDQTALDGESAHELRLREAAADGYDEDMSRVRQFDVMERLPTLAALEPLRDSVVLELGCGTGRFTVELARACRTLLAVDFSGASLAVLAAKLGDAGMVGLVQADVTRLAVAPGAFDRVASTLVSNLPTRAHREAMLRLAAGALRETGTFVFSTHHYGVRERLRRLARDGRYDAGGIYRRLF
ncbi:MAG TPA: class I SAM-dependent methyltransferase, partial [Polyangiaceae bacterium]